jgi:hypothetical protein
MLFSLEAVTLGRSKNFTRAGYLLWTFYFCLLQVCEAISTQSCSVVHDNVCTTVHEKVCKKVPVPVEAWVEPEPWVQPQPWVEPQPWVQPHASVEVGKKAGLKSLLASKKAFLLQKLTLLKGLKGKHKRSADDDDESASFEDSADLARQARATLSADVEASAALDESSAALRKRSLQDLADKVDEELAILELEQVCSF